MANIRKVVDSWLALGEERAVNVLKESWKEYMKLIFDILNDIYDSCIADYYAQREPLVYTRHGNIFGENLYLAKNFSMPNMFIINDDIDPNRLMPYPGKRGDEKREIVFNMITDWEDNGQGWRGGPGVPGFPMEFDTSYPNRHSRMTEWESSQITIKGILDDFRENILDDTDDLMWDIIAKHVRRGG